jgi:hypothetical protein
MAAFRAQYEKWQRSRILSVAVLSATVSISAANAQYGGTPECPLGFPQWCPVWVSPPLVCQRVLALRIETQKNATSIRALTDESNAQHRPLDSVETCRLFEVYLAAESKFILELQNNAETCGFSAQTIKEVAERYGKDSEVGKQICNTPFKWDSAVAPGRLPR